MSAHGGDPPAGEDRTHGGGAAAAGDGSGALSKAWAQAEHCLPLDDVVRREVWEGSIPIRIELAKQDVCDFEQPMPFYLQVASTDGCLCICGACHDVFRARAARLRQLCAVLPSRPASACALRASQHSPR
jgi:hypothetical protein